MVLVTFEKRKEAAVLAVTATGTDVAAISLARVLGLFGACSAVGELAVFLLLSVVASLTLGAVDLVLLLLVVSSLALTPPRAGNSSVSKLNSMRFALGLSLSRCDFFWPLFDW